MAQQALSVAIIGGGIGGLAAALSLLRAGIDAHVYEQAGAIGEIGAGIQISPNAARILHRFGLADAMDKVGVRPLWRHQRRWQDGRTLVRAELGEAVARGCGAPYYNFHRAELIELLAAALPSSRVHLGHRLVGIPDQGDRIEARFGNGQQIAADVIVGADGIHSAVRAALFGPEKPRFTGCIAYRGLVPAERVAHLGLEVEAQNWMGPGRHFVHYFVSGRRLVNCVAIVEEDSWTAESWTDRGEVADLRAAYAGWHPIVQGLIAEIDETFKWALHDRLPLPRWSQGRATLLGDACHAMLPMMAQGAAQAIEDGAALAACLQGVDRSQVVEALSRYEQLRKPRASRIQALSAANKVNFHMPDGPEQQTRDARMAAGSTDWSAGSVGWIYRHDAEEAARGQTHGSDP
jgi:salicylate hydroxylase